MGERFTPQEYQALKQQPEAKDYRAALALALSLARSYDGSEAQYETLMSSLEHLEEIVQTTPGIEAEDTQEKEVEAALKFAPLRPRDIQDVLSVAGASRQKAIHAAFSKEKRESPFFVQRVKGVFLPPKEGLGPTKERKGNGMMEGARFEERLSELLTILNELKVYSDDLVITQGENPPQAMRSESYLLVEIPRLGRQVLVNNEVGEATFVLKRIFPEAELLSLTKDELQSRYPQDVHRVVRRSLEQWQDELKQYLAVGQSWDQSKVDVRDMVQRRLFLIEAIKKDYSPEAWMDLGFHDKNGLTIAGYSLNRISRAFGVPDATNSRLYQLQIGQVVWPEHEGLRNALRQKELEVETRDMSADQLIKVVRAQLTPEYWLSRTTQTAREIDVNGVGVIAIGLTLGVPGHPLHRREAFLEIGAKIWPEDKAICHKLEVLHWDKARWIQEIKSVMTPETWAALRQKFAVKLKIEEKGLMYIGGVMGMPEFRYGSMKMLYDLGRIIWPEREDLWSQKVRRGQKKRTDEPK